jgi:hypothetical protein
MADKNNLRDGSQDTRFPEILPAITIVSSEIDLENLEFHAVCVL